MWWSDGSHVKEELDHDTLGDIGVDTQGYSGVVTVRNTWRQTGTHRCTYVKTHRCADNR